MIAKTCNTCNEIKNITEFHLDCSNSSGHRNKCKQCCKDYDATRKLERKNSYLKRTYGITHNHYLKMLEDQDGCCDACGLPATEEVHGVLDVDHCHETGNVRGLLCRHCNLALGNAREDINVLLGLIDYIKKHSRDC